MTPAETCSLCGLPITRPTAAPNRQSPPRFCHRATLFDLLQRCLRRGVSIHHDPVVRPIPLDTTGPDLTRASS